MECSLLGDRGRDAHVRPQGVPLLQAGGVTCQAVGTPPAFPALHGTPSLRRAPRLRRPCPPSGSGTTSAAGDLGHQRAPRAPAGLRPPSECGECGLAVAAGVPPEGWMRTRRPSAGTASLAVFGVTARASAIRATVRCWTTSPSSVQRSARRDSFARGPAARLVSCRQRCPRSVHR